MAQDYWLGGYHVLRPESRLEQFALAQSYGVTSYDPGNQDPEPPAKRSNFSWYKDYARSYLFRNSRESNREFEERCMRLINLPLFQYVITVNVSGILRTPPRRQLNTVGMWTKFDEDCDLRGTSIDAVIRQCACLAHVFGRVHVLTERIAFDTPAISKAEELFRGERPYSTIITPLDLVDWQCDDRGNFEWVVIRENEILPRVPGYPSLGNIDQYRVYYRDHWELWRVKKNDNGQVAYNSNSYELFSSGPHNVGRVPIDTLYAPLLESPSLAIESPLADVLDLNRDITNKLSELDEVERAQSFSILCTQEDTDGISEIDISPWRTITFPMGAMMPQYVSPPAELANGKWSRIIAKTFTIRQLAAVSRGKSEYSKEERSADALSIEFEDKHANMASWAISLEKFDQKIHETAAAWMSMTPPFRAVYNKTFDVKSLNGQLNELSVLLGLGVGSDELRRELMRPIVIKKLTDSGLEQDVAEGLVDSATFEEKKIELPNSNFNVANSKEDTQQVTTSAEGNNGS